jgi:hypothetical protein
LVSTSASPLKKPVAGSILFGGALLTSTISLEFLGPGSDEVVLDDVVVELTGEVDVVVDDVVDVEVLPSVEA